MSTVAYEELRDSGDHWLGRVPSHWTLGRLKHALAQPVTDGPHSTPVFVDEGVPFLSVDGIQDGELVFESCRYISESDHAEFTKKADPQLGDILMGKAASTGKIARVKVDFEFSIWSPLALIRIDGRVARPDFVEFWLKSPAIQSHIDVRCNANTQKNIGMGDISALPILLPPLDEQAAIAAFLDRETGKIDGLVEAQRRLIELLKEKRQAVISHAVTKGLDPAVPMKESGVEWLGEVPAHWEFLALSRLVDDRRPVTYGIVQPGPSDPEGRFMVRGQDYSTTWAEPAAIFRVSAAVEEPYRRARLRVGDIVMTIVGAGVGNVAVVPIFLDGANITQTTARIAAETKLVDPSYLELCLRSDLGRTQVRLFQKGAAQPGLNLEHLKAFRVTLPPLAEQRAILSDVEAKLRGLDPLIELAEKAMVLLGERRSALISAAVTGKIDVRGPVPEQAEAA